MKKIVRGKSMYRWVCKKCGMSITAATRPSGSGCPAGGLHNWLGTRYDA